MPNQLLTISDITNEGLDVLENELVFTKRVRRDFDDRFGEEGAKIGDTINIRKPARFQGHRGQAIQIEDFVETSVPLVLSQQYQQAFSFTSKDMKLSLDMFRSRVLKPAIVPVANMIDSDGTQLFLQCYQEVGTPGTTPNTTLTYLQAAQKLDEASVPDDDWTMLISPAMNAVIVDAMKGLFNPQRTVMEQTSKGLMGLGILEFEQWFRSQNAPSFTTGTQGGTPITTSAVGQTGSSILTQGWTASIKVLNKGDIITFAGCYAVNYVGKQAYSTLAQWLVTADVTSDSGGAATVKISGPDGAGIIPVVAGTNGPATANASASPTASGTITVQGASAVTSQRGLGFHKSFAAFGCADLPMPNGVDMGARKSDDQLGLSFRIVRAYDINTDRFPARCDLLGGWAVLYPQFGVRVAS